MNRNLFEMEFKRNIPGIIIWSVVICLLISLTMMIYPVFLANQSKIIGVLSIVPKELLQFKGISNFDDLISALGFYVSNNLIFMMLLGSIYAVVTGSGILLKEEYNRTAEYLLTRPVTRSEVFLSKAMVLLIGVTVVNIASSLVGYFSLKIVSTTPFSLSSFMIMSFNTYLLNLLFGTAGLFISVLIKRARPVTSFTIGLVLVLYFIYTISKIAPDLSYIGYVSPFRFVGVDVISPSYGFRLWNLVYFAGLIVFLSITSWAFYRRKDIYL